MTSTFERRSAHDEGRGDDRSDPVSDPFDPLDDEEAAGGCI